MINLLRFALVLAITAAAGAQEFTAQDYNNAGVQAYDAGKWADALNYFTSAYQLSPENDTVKRNLCNAYQTQANDLAEKGDFRYAAEVLLNAVGICPDSPAPLVQLGSYYLRLDMPADAQFRLEEAIELDPENVDAHDLLGQAYYETNQLPSALAEWELVVQLQPARPGLSDKLAKAYREADVERNFTTNHSAHFDISFSQNTNRGEVGGALRILERAYVELGRKFGGVYPPPPVHVIVYTEDTFKQATLLGEHVGAVYDGKIRVPLEDKSGERIEENELRRRLYHEYTHVLVRKIADDKAPWWLNEGLAETLSNELSSDQLFQLAQACQEDRLFALSQLEDNQLESLDKDSLGLAYIQAHATVRYLTTRFSANAMNQFLFALAQGSAPEEALAQVYRRNYRLLEKEVAGTYARAAAR